ncbi:MAG: HD domain-containing protein [Steroidobacteraceae bacterium]|jgi:HD superfamily phosphodiesterase
MHKRSWIYLLAAAYFSAACCIGAEPGTARSAPDWHATVRQFAKKHFKNPAWGYSHSERDYALARSLAASDHVTLDEDVLFAAAYLHDIAAFAPWGGDEPPDHSDVGADVVGTILKDTGFPMSKLDAVRAAIRTHMYYREPVGPEAIYLHDADALDWLGAIGVERIIALADPKGGDPDGPKVVKMLQDNLDQVPQRVVSPAGQAMVGQRKSELVEFLKELKSESADFRTL